MNKFKDDMENIKKVVNRVDEARKLGNTSEALDILELLHVYVCDALNDAGRRRISIYKD